MSPAVVGIGSLDDVHKPNKSKDKFYIRILASHDLVKPPCQLSIDGVDFLDIPEHLIDLLWWEIVLRPSC